MGRVVPGGEGEEERRVLCRSDTLMRVESVSKGREKIGSDRKRIRRGIEKTNPSSELKRATASKSAKKEKEKRNKSVERNVERNEKKKNALPSSDEQVYQPN